MAPTLMAHLPQLSLHGSKGFRDIEVLLKIFYCPLDKITIRGKRLSSLCGGKEPLINSHSENMHVRT